MQFRTTVLLPAAATLARAVRAQGFALTSARGAGVRQVLSSGGFTPGSESRALHTSHPPVRRETAPRPTQHAVLLLLLSRQLRGGCIRNMATAAAAAPGGGGEGSSGILDLKTAQEVVDFWFGKDLARLADDKEYGQSYGAKWFGFGPPDEAFIGTQNASKELIQKAASGELTGEDWEGPNGALAKLLLLDQFPRTTYRGTARAFEHDEVAAALSLEVISKGWDTMDAGHYTFEQRMFVYLPLMHSETIEAQDTSVSKTQTVFEEEMAARGSADPMKPEFAQDHRRVVARFGRFPHRNAPLGRESTEEEIEWLKSDDVPVWAKSQAAPSPPEGEA